MTHLDVAGLLDSLDEPMLQGEVVAAEVHAGHGRDHHVGLRHGGDERRVVLQRRLHQPRALRLEREQHLELVDVQADLRPHQDQRRVPLRQARPHDPPADEPGAAHHQHPALLHGLGERTIEIGYLRPGTLSVQGIKREGLMGLVQK